MKTRKVIINSCFGGFSLSPRAMQRMCELQGKPCYFFDNKFTTKPGEDKYKPLTLEQAERQGLMVTAFTVPNPAEILKTDKDWHELTLKERQKHSELYQSINVNSQPDRRDDPHLVQVVEELGKKANGRCADLAVVKIPADVLWEVQEYDGNEHIAEVHRTWA